jgi:hypothetical protein
MRRDSAILSSLPRPADIHREIGRLIRRTQQLRQLLRLAKKIHETEGDQRDNRRESEVPDER